MGWTTEQEVLRVRDDGISHTHTHTHIKFLIIVQCSEQDGGSAGGEQSKHVMSRCA